MRHISLQRMLAVFIKEFQQMRRDRLTFAMMVGVPIMQLVLFGYAINTDPKSLPTALVVAESSPLSRSLVAVLENTGYFHVTHLVAQRGRGEGTDGGWQRAVRRADSRRLLAPAGSRRTSGPAGVGRWHRPFRLGQCDCGTERHRRAGAGARPDRAAAVTAAAPTRRSNCACTGATTRKGCRATTSCPA